MVRFNNWLLSVGQFAMHHVSSRSRRRRQMSLEQLESRVLLAASIAPNEILVQYRADSTDFIRAEARNAVGGTLTEQIHTRAMVSHGQGIMERITLPSQRPVDAAIAALKNNPHVQYAEPNWIYTPSYLSNDPYYTTSSRLWVSVRGIHSCQGR